MWIQELISSFADIRIFDPGSGYYGTEFGFRPKIFRQPTAIKYPAGYFICF